MKQEPRRFTRRADRAFSIVVSIMLCSCAPNFNNSDEVIARIATCNAGFNITFDVDGRLAAQRFAAGEVSAGATLKRSFVGAYLQTAEVTEENAIMLYQEYVSCIDGSRSRDELIVLLDSRKQALISKLESLGLPDVEVSFLELYDGYVDAIQENRRIVAHESMREITELLVRTSIDLEQNDGIRVRLFLSEPDSRPKRGIFQGYEGSYLTYEEIVGCIVGGNYRPDCPWRIDMNSGTQSQTACCDFPVVNDLRGQLTSMCRNFMGSLTNEPSAICLDVLEKQLKSEFLRRDVIPSPCDYAVGPEAQRDCFDEIFWGND